MSEIHSSSDRKRARFWNQLLDLIAKGDVVPIVGEELLQLPGEPPGTTLYQALAKRYADLCGIELEEQWRGNLSATVRRHPDFRDSPFNVYDDLGKEYEQWNPPIPETLRALAKITHLNLFVSTTFDDCLERALNEARFEGKRRTEVIAYSPKNVPSEALVTDKLGHGLPVVFQCFGNYRTPLQFALTEGDIVEYLHALQTAEYRPKRIFSELYERPLLLLGNSFPDWLTRIFLRMVRQKSLHHGESKQYVADSKKDPQLLFFLRNFTINTEVIDEMNPAEFVMELAAKWTERFGDQTAAKPAPTLPLETKAMSQNSVFISYCRTDANGGTARDQEVALAIRDALVARDIDVWLDRRALEGGDDYSKKIRRYINTCSVFLPLISETTDSRADGFFRMEWGWALERLPHFTGSDRQFLFPVVIDNTDPMRAKIPEEFRRIQCTRLRSESPDEEFLNRVQSLYEKARPARAA
jgi:TIR domain/SIR2-like domain